MRNDRRSLVLVVDTDQRFIDEARALLEAHPIVTARDLGEAREIVLGGRVDLVLFGPAFGSDAAISQTSIILAADASVQMVLAADVVSNRLLKTAFRSGFIEVLEMPISEGELSALVGQLPGSLEATTELRFVIEPGHWMELPEPDGSSEPMQVAPDTEADRDPESAATPPADPDSPVSVATSAEVAFGTEDAPRFDHAPTSSPEARPAVAAAVWPEAFVSRTAFEPSDPDSHFETPWSLPAEAAIHPTLPANDVLPSELPVPPWAQSAAQESAAEDL